jgi:membrane-associated phospholipid phosphatase
MQSNDSIRQDTHNGARLEQMLIAAAAGSVAIALGVATQTRKTVPLDRAVRNAVRNAIRPRRRPRVVKLAKCVSYPASPPAHTTMAIAASAVVAVHAGRFPPSPVLASLLAFGVNRGARLFVDQQRPPHARTRIGIDRFGFPSGHTTAATAVSFATAMEFTRGKSPRAKAAAYLAAGVCSAAVGWSRLALDEHWIDDVMGGWTIGIAIANIAVAACDAIDAR